MWVKRVVLLKAVVTESFRAEKLREIEDALNRVDLTRRHLDYQEQRLQSLPESEEKRAIGPKIALERRRQTRLESRLQGSRGELAALPDGAEFLIGQMEGFIEPKAGMPAASLTGPAEIVIRDGAILEVREQ